MRSRRAKWTLALIAALLNLAGSPMAWASALGSPSIPDATSTLPPAEESCHGQAEDQPQAPDSMPCCEGGSCYCAAPAQSVALVAETRRLPAMGANAPFDTSTLPANPLDDSLRPPIR
jgi:hypothetical protein